MEAEVRPLQGICSIPAGQNPARQQYDQRSTLPPNTDGNMYQ